MAIYANETTPATQELPNTNLVDWANPPTLLALKGDLLAAQPNHDLHIAKVNNWLDNLLVKGSAKVNNNNKSSSVVPKLIRKQAEWRYTSLSEPFLSTDDIFNCSPVTYEDKKAAEQNQLVLNHQFNNKIKKIDFIDEYIRTAVDEGSVVVRVGWDYQEETVLEEKKKYTFIQSNDPLTIQKLTEIQELYQTDPITYESTISQEDKQAFVLSLQYKTPFKVVENGTEFVNNTKVIKNCPTLEICDYRNVIIDPTCFGDLDKANFVIYRFQTNRASLEKDGRYSNLDKIIPDTTLISAEFGYHKEAINFNFKDKPREKFYAYEYWGFWDINNDGIIKPIVVTWVGNQIIRMEENPFPDKKLPFVKVQYLPVRKSNYGEPDGELLVENQKILGAVTRGMIDLMGKSANSQQGIRKDALDLVNRRKFERGEDYEFNPNVDPQQAFYMHKFPDIPQSAQFMYNLMNMEAESLTGVKTFSQGVNGDPLGSVAVGVRGALEASSKREMGILRRLKQGIIEIARKITSMNAVWLSEEEVIRITNDNFVTIKRDDLAGNIDIKINISTAEADEQKAQELSFMLQTMGNTMPQEFSQMILAEIAKLRNMPDLAKKIETYQPQPDPMQEQLQQLQMQLLQAQIQAEQAKAMENQAQAMYHQAQAQSLGYKANNLQAQTDKTNLDFVEQESGIAHQRAIESAMAQAQGNMQLESLKHVQEMDKMKLKHNLGLQDKTLDHVSKLEQLKVKPQNKNK